MKVHWTLPILTPLLLASCVVVPPFPRQTASPLTPPSQEVERPIYDIEFEVTTADGKLDMAKWSTLEDTAVDTNVRSPYRKRATLAEKYGLVGINASDDSRLQCRLTVNGKVLDEAESDAVVNCSATLV